MELLQRIVEQAMASGLSQVIAYVLFIPLVLLMGWTLIKLIKWYVRRMRDRFVRTVKDAVAELPRQSAAAGMNFVAGATGRVVPAVQAGANVAANTLKAGAVAARFQATKIAPVVRDAAINAADVLQAGAIAGKDHTMRATPIIREAAIDAASAIQAGAIHAKHQAVKVAPTLKDVAADAVVAVRNRAFDAADYIQKDGMPVVKGAAVMAASALAPGAAVAVALAQRHLPKVFGEITSVDAPVVPTQPEKVDHE